MRASLPFFALFFLLSLFSSSFAGEYVYNTRYWQGEPQTTTCSNYNESMFQSQLLLPTNCKDGTDVPWNQVPNPKARLYFCTDNGELMYKECAPFQYAYNTSCKINCSDPIPAGVTQQCYEGVGLNVISCKRHAPVLTGTYYQADNGLGIGSDAIKTSGPQSCRAAFGPYGSGYACNSTHFWTLTSCVIDCTNCVAGPATPIGPGDRCLNSRVLSCYEGHYSSSNASIPTPLVTKTVDSDTVCASVDYKCHLGDCTCSDIQQVRGTCKTASSFLSSDDCNLLRNSSYQNNHVCCATDGCNAPVPGAIPCAYRAPTAAPTPPPTPKPTPNPTLPPFYDIYDDRLARGWAVYSTGAVDMDDTTRPYSGDYSIQFQVLSSSPELQFACRACTQGYTTLRFSAYAAQSRTTVTVFMFRATVKTFIQTISIPSGTWTRVVSSVPQGIYDGFGISFHNTVQRSTAFVDVVMLES